MIPGWLRPIETGAASMTVADLTRFPVPPGVDARPCAVLVLFADGDHGPEVVLTERAHDMRSHPGQVSFAGGALEPGESVEEAALREAWEEIGLEPASVATFGRLPELWMPPSNSAVTPVLAWWREPHPVHARSPEEVHAVHREPIADLLDPTYRFTVRHPSGLAGPGFWIGPDRDVMLWGFTGGIVSRLFDHVGWTRPWDDRRTEELPEAMVRPEERIRLTPEQMRGLGHDAPPVPMSHRSGTISAGPVEEAPAEEAR